MVTERFTVVALPHSVAPKPPFHVSLFISPQLVPDASEGELKEFEVFPHWAAALLDGTEIELSDQIGSIPAEPLFDPVMPEVWDAVFPPDTPVRGTKDPELRGRHWRTFRAAELHDSAKLLHVVAMFANPTSPPLPRVHPLSRVLERFGGLGEGRHGYDESRITRSLDDTLGELGKPGEETIPLPELEAMIDGQQDPFARLAMHLHRARRFYERPESETEYLERPVEGATSPRPPRPEPEFHERCSLVGDHPSLQRRLGLVVDLLVEDPDRLRESQWLSAIVAPKGDASGCRTTRTRCQVVGEDLVTTSATEDWAAEVLRLGDPNRFALLDMDPDGTALKLDRFIWTVPRLLAIEENGDPIHAAPTALRSIGFTVVRNQKATLVQDRMDRQTEIRGEVAGAEPPLLRTEDVTQGLRVDVWDDEVGAWFTLHARRIDAEALGHGEIVHDLSEEGFIQGTAATETPGVDKSPVHVHESMFGWEGWSLSAARPGKRVRHEDGDEVVEDPDTDPDFVTPLIVTSSVEPGTLPRLRYGRSYAFRARAVNLAGNSRVREVGSPPEPTEPTLGAAATALAAGAPHVPAPSLLATMRSETAAGVLRGRFAVIEEGAVPLDLSLLGDPGVERIVLARLRTRRAETRSRARSTSDVTADRSSLVVRAFGDVAVDEDQPFIVDTAIRDAQVVARAIVPSNLADAAEPWLADLITPIKPFLRWDPVQPPAVIARHRFSAGESLRQLVIRSGVTQDLETLEISVKPPNGYAAAHAGLGYRPTAERHLAPPKTSQSEAELHGAFDDAIGSTDPNDHLALLAVALREAGTFYDQDVPRLDDPSQRDPQPGIDLVADPTVPPSTLKTLPLSAGEAPAPGQYVIHDTNHLALPYLPDVLARGISLVFPEAGRDRMIAFPFGTEGFTARYSGAWPERKPFRLVLEGDDVLSGELAGRVLRIALPPGDVQRFRLASSLRRDDLELFGLWRSLPPAIHDNPDVAEAAADGWLWAFTPFEEVTLVHAVPRPLEAPRPTTLAALRPGEGSTDVAFLGAVDLHGPSTEMLSAEAYWVDPIDDLTLPAPDERTSQQIAFTSPVRESEDLAVLYGGAADVQITVPGAGPVWLHSAIQRLGDTRHHRIDYRLRAATRFREYFDPSTLAPPSGGPPAPGGPVDDGQSVVGPQIELSVPSSSRPAAPIVHSVLPLFRWDEGTEPEQPVATRRRRRAGVRIYLERPWFSSGEGELLGVLLAPAGNDLTALRHPVSQWGADPVWVSAPVGNRAMFLELDNLLRALGLEDRPGDALPIAPPATLPLTAVPGSPLVTVLGYRPQYSVERQKWYVDVAIDPGSTFWPFVRFAVARYQPDSVTGMHLSAPVRCNDVQLTPERTASVSRTDVRHVRVVVSGPIGVRETPSGETGTVVELPPGIEDYDRWVRLHRTVIARLQRTDPAIPTDLGWETVNVVELTVRGFGRNPYEAAWVGELESPVNLQLRTPGANPDWRVTIEEWERLPGDPEDLADLASPPVWEQRLIYADEIML